MKLPRLHLSTQSFSSKRPRCVVLYTRKIPLNNPHLQEAEKTSPQN